MNKSNSEMKPKFLISVNKQERLSVLIPQRLSKLIAEYRDFHKEVSGDEATLDSLVAAFLNSAVASDKSFVNWKKNKAGQAKQSAKRPAKVEDISLEIND